ncbi:OmpA family protein [Algoriphagus sp. SE2]|uniref:OmpA family protein n=1 Tax=Algoriphagus sp. SE2 TaxID=3141536 RepID=UPI0031D5AD1A
MILSIASLLIFGMTGTLKAQKSKIRYADSLILEQNYKTAIELYQEAYEQKPEYPTAKKTAQTYELLRDYDNTYLWWKKVVDYEESTPGDFIQFLRYAQLTDQLSEARDILGAKGIGADSIQVEELLKIQSPRKVKLTGVEGLNSTESDFGITLDSEGNKYFVSDRGGTYIDEMPAIRIDGRNKIFSEEKQNYTGREYLSVYRQNTDGEVKEVASNIPNTYNFSDPNYAKEAGILFYSVTRGIKKVKKNRNITVQPEIYYSRVNEDGELEGFTPVPFNDSIGYAVMNPYIDEESKRLYFTSNMPGGIGGYDLYYSAYDDNMNFSSPVNLGPEVNTVGNESHAFREDSKFYFSSTGHKGMGGMDIFVADYSENSIDNVRNMGAPVNSVADDFAYIEVIKEGMKPEVYLSSNRKGGIGLDDIYSVEEIYKRFLARVVDCEGILINDPYETTLRNKSQDIEVQTSIGAEGVLLADLEPESDFGIKISKSGYFSITDEEITTRGFVGDTLKKEYKLIPIPYKLPVYVDIVYYDLDKFLIREDAKPILDKLAELMNRYSFLDLLVSSYTDARASDEYNMTLSKDRAKAVTDYMAKHSVSASRIRLEWFGEKNLVNDCGDGVACADSEQQLNRRSELILEAFSDTTKQYEIPEEMKGSDFCDPEELFKQIQDVIAQIPTVYFDFDKSMLRSIHKKELERTAIMLKRMPNLRLYIEGHADQRGEDNYNQKLSERRAEAVKSYLLHRGIEENRIEETWFGESRPIHNCNEITCTPAMHQLNRRTELRIGKTNFK